MGKGEEILDRRIPREILYDCARGMLNRKKPVSQRKPIRDKKDNRSLLGWTIDRNRNL